MDRNQFKFTFEDGSEALAHYGVLGMKWGVRKDYGHSGHLLDGMVNKNTPQAEKNRKFLSENPDAFPKKASQSSPLEDMRAINPYYTAASVNYDIKDFFNGTSEGLSIGSTEVAKWKGMRGGPYGEALINCASCSVAFDLRRRGYDIQASMGANVASNLDLLACYPGADFKAVHDPMKLFNIMRDAGCYEPGASGIVTFFYKETGTGHAIAFSTDENGEMHFYDCQTKEETGGIPLPQFIEDTAYMRLDNVEPDLEYINSKGCVAPTPHKSEPKNSKGTIKDPASRIKETANAVKTVQDMKKTLKGDTQSKPVESTVKDALSKASGTVEAAKMKQDIKKMLRGDGR